MAKNEKKVDVFEIRIPNLRQDEIEYVRRTIANFTKKLLNTLQIRRDIREN